MLGAAALGDIGVMFPPSDARWKDASSLVMLRMVDERVRADGHVASVTCAPTPIRLRQQSPGRR